MSKKAIKRLILLVIVISIIFGLTYKHDIKNEKELMDDVNSVGNLIAFQEQGKKNDKSIQQGTSNIQTSPEFELENRMDFLENISNKDNGICAINGIHASFKYLELIIGDLKKFNSEEYYEANKITIYQLYGIQDSNSFNAFITNILSVGELKKYRIDIDKIEENGTELNLIVSIIGSEGSCTIPIKAISKIDEYTSSIFIE